MSKLMNDHEIELMIKDNMRLEATVEELRSALRRQGNAASNQCGRCDTKSRYIGALLGVLLGTLWTFTFPSGIDHLLPADWISANSTSLFVWGLVVLAAGPLTFVLLRKRFLRFKQREEWKRWPSVVAYQAYRAARKSRKR